MPSDVETRYGRIRGSETRGVHVFRGVPFARPPVGPYRFRAPAPPEPWTGLRWATQPGPAAVQASVPGLQFLSLSGGLRQSEDCLYLNVWTPGLDAARRPVLVWIHGGGFLIGSGSTPLYNGEQLARRQDLVVVTINYRLGALGFVHLDGIFGEAFRGASNAGVRDQIAALEWVRDNIDRFGGDPGNVTVCGQSAGAISIGALLASPRARPLFRRAICQSGSTHHALTREQADQVARVFVRALGGPPGHPDALARIPVERILKAQGRTNRRLADWTRLMVYLPAVDGDVLPEHPRDAVARGAAADVSLLVGTTLDEWKLFAFLDAGLPTLSERRLVKRLGDMLPQVAQRAPEPAVAARRYREAVCARGGKTSPFEVWSAFQSARVFHVPASRLAEAQSRARAPVYSYLFTWRPPALRRALGAFHAIDVPFVFGLTRHAVTRPLFGLAETAADLSRCMQAAWAGFARDGVPAYGGLPEWSRYDATDRSTMVLGRRPYLAAAPLEPERRLWEAWS